MDFEAKKITFVANTAWSMFNFRYGVLRRLLNDGYKLTVIAPPDDFSDKLRFMGCAVIDLAMSGKGTNPVEDINLLSKLYSLYRIVKPDFIIHYTIKPNIYGSIAAKLAGIPSLAITTGLGYTFVNDNLVSKIARRLYKLAFKYPKEVWFLNECDLQVFLKNRLVSSDKAVLLHGEGVDLEHFFPQPKRQSSERVRFLLVARMLWDKGIGEYISAARVIKEKYPQAEFRLLGACDVANPSAIERTQIAAWEEEGLITYLGMTTDVRPIISDADCVVLPSFYSEGIPRSLMEAAAMEKPIITTDNVGCRDVVLNGKTGLLCQVKAAKSLAFACETFINMSCAERINMGCAGREYMAEKFDEQRVIKQYLNTLTKYGVVGRESS